MHRLKQSKSVALQSVVIGIQFRREHTHYGPTSGATLLRLLVLSVVLLTRFLVPQLLGLQAGHGLVDLPLSNLTPRSHWTSLLDIKSHRSLLFRPSGHGGKQNLVLQVLPFVVGTSFQNCLCVLASSMFNGAAILTPYSYTGSNIVADVSYDMFTSSTATGSNEYEIMIWLAALGGAGPISATGSPIATPTIAGTTWNLSYGLNGATKVFSFVAQSEVMHFSADLKLFFNYLATYQDFTASQYLKSINSGTEPFTGSNAVLTTTAYSVYYVMGTSSGTTTSSASKAVTSTASKTTSTASSGTGAALWGQCGEF